jgi:hypothetical protein
VLDSLALVAPASPRELARVLAALQSSLMRDAAMPSHGNVVSVAALRSATRLAAAFPAARRAISEQLAFVTTCSSLSPQVRRQITSSRTQRHAFWTQSSETEWSDEKNLAGRK